MNYIKTFIFLICILAFNYIVGTACLKVFKKEKSNFTLKIVAGFITLFLLGFCVGLPAQVLAASWTIYFIAFCIVMGIVLILSILFVKHDLINVLKRVKKKPLYFIKHHLLQYWFIYLLVFFFSAFSILNTQPYLWCNYHDDYYIAKVVNLQGAPHLLDEQYLLGLKIVRSSFFTYISAQGYRFLNTYEVTYAALGSIFGIDLAFFCRFSICIYMYLIVFLTYKLLAEKFIKNIYTSQYALLVFSLLLIPAGYASGLKLSIRMFENWRFQTAIYYGGSIVRVLGLPLFILSFSELINKINIKSIFSFLCCFILLLSFQTSALSYLFFIAPILLFLLILKGVNIKVIGRKKNILFIIIVTLFLLLITLSDQILSCFPIDMSRCNDLIKSYTPYYNDIFICDIFALFGFIPVAMSLYLDRKKDQLFYIDLFILCAYLVFRFNKSNYYIAMVSQYLFYSALRIMTSVLLLIIFSTGVFVVNILSKVKQRISQIIIPIVSLAMVLCTVTNVYANRGKVIKYTKEAQSATPQGYSLKILTDNDKMLPDMIANVGNYFNKLPYGNYRLLSEGQIPYKNTYIDNESFLLASNRIELFFNGTKGEEESNSNYRIVLKFLKGEADYSTAVQIIRQSGIKYIFTTREKCKNELVANNNKILYNDKENHAWLIAIV